MKRKQLLCLFKMTRQILKKPKETCWLPKWYFLNKERKILQNIQSVCYCFCFSCAFCFCFSNSFQARSKHWPQNSSTKNDKYIYIYILGRSLSSLSKLAQDNSFALGPVKILEYWICAKSDSIRLPESSLGTGVLLREHYLPVKGQG